MPIWLRLPNLPLHFWSPGSISKIASVVGRPLYLDDKSANVSKMQFARVCVEVSAHKPLPISVSIEIEGEETGRYEQMIEYETSLKCCTKCAAFGHSDEKCYEASKIKPTVFKKRRTKPAFLAPSPIVNGEDPAKGHEEGEVISSKKFSENPLISEPIWTLVTNKKKVRKKKAASSSKIVVSQEAMKKNVDQPKENRRNTKTQFSAVPEKSLPENQKRVGGTKSVFRSTGLEIGNILDDQNHSDKGKSPFQPKTAAALDFCRSGSLTSRLLDEDASVAPTQANQNQAQELSGSPKDQNPDFSLIEGTTDAIVSRSTGPALHSMPSIATTRLADIGRGSMHEALPKNRQISFDLAKDMDVIPELDRATFATSPVGAKIVILSQPTTPSRLTQPNQSPAHVQRTAIPNPHLSPSPLLSLNTSPLPTSTPCPSTQTQHVPTFMAAPLLPLPTPPLDQPQAQHTPNPNTTLTRTCNEPNPIPNPNPQDLAHLNPLPILASPSPSPSSSLTHIQAQTPPCTNPTLIQAQPPPNQVLAPQTQADSSEESSEELDFSFPPGFTPDKEDLSALREIMKEGVSLLPPEHQQEFIMSVDLAKDGEILDFFHEKFKKNPRADNEENFLTHQNVRHSPRMRKKPARLTDMPSSSGLKKGFLK